MLEWITNPEAWIVLFTLTGLEIVLGIDNIIVITILVSRLPQHQHRSARILGLGLAMMTRILLLLSLAWMARLVDPIFSVLNQDISGRDLILIIGGFFLIIKSSTELKEAISGKIHHHTSQKVRKSNYIMTLVQIAIIDIVFSLDSVITAVGMANDIPVMVLAIVIAVGVMMIAANSIGDFVDRHPTIKNLALSFLILIGIALIGEGLDTHIPKIAVYTAMGFSVIVELLNIKMRKNIEKNQATNKAE